MNPFTDIRVVPTYGDLKARIIWKVAPGFEKGRFIVFKSPDGVTDWEEIGAVDALLEFSDEHLLTSGRLEERYYKIILQDKGHRFDSPIISTFGKLSRQEFAHARYIMDLEWRSLKGLTDIRIFKIKTNGSPCEKCVDAATGQRVGVSLCEECYGTGYQGGFRAPIASRMRVAQISPKLRENSQSGAGASDPMRSKVRMIAFPLLDYQDMVVDPAADRRYSIETVEYDWLNGKVPITATVQLNLIERNDIRYTVGL